MTISTKLEVKYVSDLICILLRFPTFITLLNNFGIVLLPDCKLPQLIDNLEIRPKLTHILQKFCRNYGPTYERIISVLNVLGLQSVSGAVEAEANQRRLADAEGHTTKSTKIEYNDIVEIRKILLKDLKFASEINKFAHLLGIETANELPKKNVNRALYKFHERFPERAVFEYLIDVLKNQMGHTKLAGDIQTKFIPNSNNSNGVPKFLGKYSHKSLPLSQTSKSHFKKDTMLKDQQCQTMNVSPPFPSTLKAAKNTQTSNGDVYIDDCVPQCYQDQLEEMKKSDYEPEFIIIKDGETGHSYEKLFGKFLTDSTHTIEIQDPYLEEPHQVKNLKIFLDLVFKNCSHLKKISIISKNYSEEKINKLIKSLDIEITLKCSEIIHDRHLKIWYLKNIALALGRGFDTHKIRKSDGSECNQEDLKSRGFTIASVPDFVDLSGTDSSVSSDEIKIPKESHITKTVSKKKSRKPKKAKKIHPVLNK